jgi:hypothetical protein
MGKLERLRQKERGMTRTLDFSGEKGPTRFDLLYEAFLGGGATQTKAGDRSRSILRQEARILEQLEKVSEPDASKLASCEACGRQANEDARKLRPIPDAIAVGMAVPGIIVLTEDDHALIVKYVDARPWLPRMARRVVDVQDWLSSAPKQE